MRCRGEGTLYIRLLFPFPHYLFNYPDTLQMLNAIGNNNKLSADFFQRMQLHIDENIISVQCLK